jgi:hypothetical protein
MAEKKKRRVIYMTDSEWALVDRLAALAELSKSQLLVKLTKGPAAK